MSGTFLGRAIKKDWKFGCGRVASGWRSHQCQLAAAHVAIFADAGARFPECAPGDAAALALAEVRFKELTGADFTAAKRLGEGKSEVLRSFDPMAEEMRTERYWSPFRAAIRASEPCPAGFTAAAVSVVVATAVTNRMEDSVKTDRYPTGAALAGTAARQPCF
jgi:hypothetical protein